MEAKVSNIQIEKKNTKTQRSRKYTFFFFHAPKCIKKIQAQTKRCQPKKSTIKHRKYSGINIATVSPIMTKYESTSLNIHEHSRCRMEQRNITAIREQNQRWQVYEQNRRLSFREQRHVTNKVPSKAISCHVNRPHVFAVRCKSFPVKQTSDQLENGWVAVCFGTVNSQLLSTARRTTTNANRTWNITLESIYCKHRVSEWVSERTSSDQ